LRQESFRYCLVLPHFNHVHELAAFLPQLLSLHLPCIVVDDGSNEEELVRLTELVSGYSEITLIEHSRNRGKGAAVMTAAMYARTLGMTHIIQIDADGQHNSDDVFGFIDASRELPDTIVCGRPVFDSNAPKARVYGRKVTDFWVAIETLSVKIKDGLCGFRVYPLDQMEYLADHHYLGARMDFDTEVLVKAVWCNTALKFIDTKVQYIEDGRSHFHYLRDNLVLIRLHVRLMFGMIIRLPILIANKFKS